MTKSLVLRIAVACFLTSCSPYVYKTEITSFSNGVNSVAASYDAGQTSVANLVAQQQQQQEITARTKLDLLPGCDAVDATGTPPKFPDCAVVKLGATAAPAATEAQVALANAAPAFTALKNYAAALAAVTNASDDASLTQAAQNLASSATGLTTAAAKLVPGASAENAALTAAGSVFGELATIYLDSRRLAVLRADVPAVDNSISVLGNTVTAALLVIRAQQLLQMQKDMHVAAAPLQSDSAKTLKAADYQNDLSALEAKVGAFNQTRAADPTAAVTAMVNAHHQLAQALASNAGQLQAVYTAAQSFYNAASQLQKALSASLSAPASTKSKPPS